MPLCWPLPKQLPKPIAENLRHEQPTFRIFEGAGIPSASNLGTFLRGARLGFLLAPGQESYPLSDWTNQLLVDTWTSSGSKQDHVVPFFGNIPTNEWFQVPLGFQSAVPVDRIGITRHLWESLFGIHLFHFRIGQGGNAQFWEKLTPWLYEHVYLFTGAGLGLALLGFKRREVASGALPNTSSQSVRMLFLVVGAHIAVVLAMTEAAFLYIVAIAPLLTLLAGIGFDATVVWWRERRELSQARYRRASRLMLAGVAATVALTAAGWAVARSHREHLDERQYSFWPHVLHGQVSRFQQLDVAWRVARDSALPKAGTIFGDPTIVSAVALHSGLRVAGELADLNPSWLEAGTVSREEVVSRIERDGVAAVITSPWFMVQDPYFRSYLMACYEIPKIFSPPDSGPGAGLFDILVYPHTRGTSPCHVPRR